MRQRLLRKRNSPHYVPAHVNILQREQASSFWPPLNTFFPHRCKKNWNQPGYVVLFERSPPLWQGHHEGPCVWAGNAQRQRGCGGETSARLCFVHQLVHSKGTCAVITFHGLCFMFLKLYVYWHLSLFSCVLSQLQKHFHNKLQNFVLWELKKPN